MLETNKWYEKCSVYDGLLNLFHNLIEVEEQVLRLNGSGFTSLQKNTKHVRNDKIASKHAHFEVRQSAVRVKFK